MPELLSAACVDAVLALATEALSAAGCDTPRLDAELLLAWTLGTTRAGLVVGGERELEPASLRRFEKLVGRRAEREPVAYILGRREFRWISLAVDRRALIPRPETELLVEAALSLPPGSRVVDVGTGSGAVALALKQERPDRVVWGTDVSEEALALARENAARLDLEVGFLQADLLDGLEGSFEAVLANLPYVAEGETLAPEVARYEPAAALWGGPDGLEQLRRLTEMLDGVSFVALEVGWRQAAAVEELLRARGFAVVKRLQDLAGHDRVLVARR